jgi:hypothetical protein
MVTTWVYAKVPLRINMFRNLVPTIPVQRADYQIGAYLGTVDTETDTQILVATPSGLRCVDRQHVTTHTEER